MSNVIMYIYIYIFLDIVDKMYENRGRKGEGGYVSEDSDYEYEEEVKKKEEEEKKAKKRKVAKVVGIPQAVESDSSDSPPPLVDTVGTDSDQDIFFGID